VLNFILTSTVVRRRSDRILGYLEERSDISGVFFFGGGLWTGKQFYVIFLCLRACLLQDERTHPGTSYNSKFFCTPILNVMSHTTHPLLLLFLFSFFLFWRNSPPVGQGDLIHEVSRSHTTTTTVGRTPPVVWLARRRDLYLTTHNTQNRHSAPGGIRTQSLSRRAAADPRLRPHGLLFL
jgi:hypothetical protein